MQIKTKLTEEQLKNNQKKINSIKNHFWVEKKSYPFIERQLIDKFKLSPILAKILAMRGIDRRTVLDFFNPKLKNLIPNPDTLDDMELATSKIVDCILKKKKFGLFGDYDVDGTTSTALLGGYFDEIGVEYDFYIPDRLNDGYGPNIKAFRELKKKDCDIIITLDCGTTSISSINSIKKENLEVIVVDHHQEGEELPDAYAIINPNKRNDKSDLKNLSAVGVLFFLIISINRELKKKNFFSADVPNLVKFLDLVALGTVCDVVELDLINRTLVKQGLKVINQSLNMGLNSLIDSSEINEVVKEYHLGYVLGPRINAGGRVGNSSLGTQLLLSTKKSMANVIAKKLGDYNNLRKKIEKQVELEAIKKVDLSRDGIICVSSDDWHPGVIGIVASKLTEKFSRPSIVISESKKICKASCRSVSNFDIGKLIFSALEEGILISGGGHQMAGGFSIDKSKVDQLKGFVNDKFDPVKNEIKKFYDSELIFSSISNELYFLLDRLSPFGPGNPKPKFLIRGCLIKFVRLVGNNHLSCFVEDVYGNRIKGVSFNAYDSDMGKFLEKEMGKELDLVVSLKLNRWNGEENAEIQIEDALIA